MAKISKSSNKKTTSKTKKALASATKPSALSKKTANVEKKIKVPIKISKNYIPKDTEKYMCDKLLSFSESFGI